MFERLNQFEHDLPARCHLRLADPPLGRALELCQQLHGLLAAAVALTLQESLKPLLAQATRIRGAGVALQERERDRTGKIAEQTDRPRPEPLQLRAQLVAHRHPGAHQILASPGQRPKRLRVITVRLEHPEPVAVSPRELTQHERVKPVNLPPETRNRARVAAT